MKTGYIETERIRQDGYWDIQCVECRAWFEAERETASFCNSTCRSRWNRRDKNRQARIDRALKALEDLIAHLPQRGDSREFLALQKIETISKSAISQVEA